MKLSTLIITFFIVPFAGFAAVPTITSFSPTSASTGTTVTITGTGFTNVSAVTFGGTPAASYTVVSPTQITAVVAAGSSGQVQVTNIDGTGSRPNFVYISTTRIITDFGGYWSSSAGSPNATVPDSSHNLLGFTYSGTLYSTGVNDGVLTSNGVSFTPGNFRALPVTNITGVTAATSTYLALAKKVDGSLNVGNTPAVSDYSIRSVLVDGPQGLNLGTGVTNLPTSAELTFQIYNIDQAKLADPEPDLILTQIAQPVTGNDVFSFVDASNNVIGSALTQDMVQLPSFGNYLLDLFNLTPTTPYNVATAYSYFSSTPTREIRLVGLRLSDFGITAANVGQVRALKITPSGNSDYAFIAYNANSINLTPNISQNPPYTNTTLCSGGTARMSVIAAGATGGALTYAWEESSNSGTSWTPVTDGGNYSGADSTTLSVVNPTDGYQYRAIVTEAGNPNPAISTIFGISIIPNPAAPTAVTVSPTTSTCLNTAVQLTSSVTGGTNLSYQWQSNASGTYTDIPGATLSTYVPPISQTGVTSYLLRVSSGSGCVPALTSSTPGATITVTGISSTTPDEICGSGSADLAATATSGTINWYDVDAGGSALATANSYTTPVLNATKTYYVASSGCASALRVPVTATISPASVGGTIAGSTTVVPGTNSTTLTLSGVTGSIVKWQSSTDMFNADITDIIHTSPELTVTNLTETTQYRAEIQSGSCAPVFSSLATITMSGTLPIHNASVKATKVNDGVLVQWTAYNQENTDRFEVERSTDGSNFTRVYTTLAIVNGGLDVDYSWLDKSPVNGASYYRIKEVYKTGNHEYSSIVQVKLDNNNKGISIYPNPVAGRNLTLQFNSMAAGVYRARIINNVGQVISQMTINHPGGSASQTLSLSQGMVRGLYKIEVSTPAGTRKNYSILVM